MFSALFRIVGAGAFVFGLASIAAAPTFAKDRTNLNVKRSHDPDRVVGARAQSRMSERGLANSNGIFMPGRTTGRDRAENRVNAHSIDRGHAAYAGRDEKPFDRRETKHAGKVAQQTDRPGKYAAGPGAAGKRND